MMRNKITVTEKTHRKFSSVKRKTGISMTRLAEDAINCFIKERFAGTIGDGPAGPNRETSKN